MISSLFNKSLSTDFWLTEWRQISRDPLLKWLLLFPIAIAFAMRFGVPALDNWLMSNWQFDFGEYHLLLLSMMPALIPSIVGMVVGFALLDMKDDGSLTAMLVTPMGLSGYLRIKLMLSTLLGLPLNMLCLVIADLMPLTFWQLVLASFSSMLLAPIIALGLALIAENKVQGFALAKVINGITFPPLLAWFFPAWWNWAFGILPTWWPMKVFWLMPESMLSASLVFAVGIVAQGALCWWLLHKLLRKGVDKV